MEQATGQVFYLWRADDETRADDRMCQGSTPGSCVDELRATVPAYRHVFTRRDDDGGPGEHPERWDWAATIGWLLGADVRVPGVDPRFRLATERVERDGGGGAGGDSVLGPGGGDADCAVLALVFAELGGTYPVAGGSGRFPFYSHGPFAGFVAAWSSWLPAVAVAPIEILGAITYVNSVAWVNRHFDMLNSDTGLLNAKGLVVATILMIAFTAMNLAGAKFMSESNGRNPPRVQRFVLRRVVRSDHRRGIQPGHLLLGPRSGHAHREGSNRRCQRRQPNRNRNRPARTDLVNT